MAELNNGMYSPPNGNAPQALPDNWLVDGVETNLLEASDAELQSLGWVGPIDDVRADYFTEHKYWDSDSRAWVVVEAGEELRRKRVNYRYFWELLLESSAYATIKAEASQTLSVNTLVTEFIALISDAKSGIDNEYANIPKIQESLNEILSTIAFSAEELTEIEDAFTNSGMYAVYTLPSAS